MSFRKLLALLADLIAVASLAWWLINVLADFIKDIS